MDGSGVLTPYFNEYLDIAFYLNSLNFLYISSFSTTGFFIPTTVSSRERPSLLGVVTTFLSLVRIVSFRIVSFVCCRNCLKSAGKFVLNSFGLVMLERTVLHLTFPFYAGSISKPPRVIPSILIYK